MREDAENPAKETKRTAERERERVCVYEAARVQCCERGGEGTERVTFCMRPEKHAIVLYLRRVFEQIAEFIFAAALGNEFGLHLGHFL